MVDRSYDIYYALQSKLLAYWDAERVDLIYPTPSEGSSVSMWRDIVAGRPATQGTGAAQPVWQSAGIGNHPGISFDGLDDTFLFNLPAGTFPSGIVPCEMWALGKSLAASSDTSTRYLFSMGDNATLRGVRASGSNETTTIFRMGGALSGTGTTTILPLNRGVLPSFCRLQTGSTQASATTNGSIADMVTGSIVPNAGAVRIRIGGSPFSVANGLFNGVISLCALFKEALTDAEAGDLSRYLEYRRYLP